MLKWTTSLPSIVAVSLLTASCGEAVGPGRHGPDAVALATGAAAAGIALDQFNGTVGETGRTLLKGFDPTNPHRGDAIIASFFWFGSTNIVTAVTDHLANGTLVGNTYTLVEYVTAGGVSMATYVATNVQNFPDPNRPQDQVLVVQADLSAPVTDAGILLSAYTGVSGVAAQALGPHRSASGSGASVTTADPGPIAVSAGALAYGITVANSPVGLGGPAGFTSIVSMSDASLEADGEYVVQASAGSVDPQWTWYFSSPRTWLATALALYPAAQGGPATRLAFTLPPGNTAAGATMSSVQVAAQDAAGITDVNYTGAITLALGTNPSGGVLSGTTTATATRGVATFSNLSIDKAGSGYTLQATASGLTGATSAAFNITPPPATHLTFTAQPTNTTAGATMSGVQVAAQDASGATDVNYTGAISIALATNPSGGVLSGTTTVTATRGVANFSNLSIDKAGSGYTLRATASGLTGATSAAFNITTSPATHLTLMAQPTNTTAGAVMSAVQIAAQDASGTTDVSYTGAITIALGTNPSGGTLSGTTTVTATRGVATFSNLSIDKAGSGYTLRATASGLTGATSVGFNITPPPAMALDQSDGTLGESGKALAQGFNVANPRRGDAIVVTFFWLGSTNIITAVTDRLANGTPVGNTYTLVEYITAGGMSMATYVATNVQNFPYPSSTWDQVLVVQADLSTAVTDGGIMLSAYTGVNGVWAQALGPHRSASGAGASITTADPGAIAVNAGALAYGVTMANDGGGLGGPAGFTNITNMSDALIQADGEYAVQTSAGSVDPRWTWYFNSSRTWLATVLTLNP